MVDFISCLFCISTATFVDLSSEVEICQKHCNWPNVGLCLNAAWLQHCWNSSDLAFQWRNSVSIVDWVLVKETVLNLPRFTSPRYFQSCVWKSDRGHHPALCPWIRQFISLGSSPLRWQKWFVSLMQRTSFARCCIPVTHLEIYAKGIRVCAVSGHLHVNIKSKRFRSSDRLKPSPS